MKTKTEKAKPQKLFKPNNLEIKDETDSWWWLSYANPDGFNGAFIVQAKDFLWAIAKVNSTGLCPGGQVSGIPMTISESDLQTLAPYTNRLLSKDECDRLEEIMGDA